MIDRRNGSQSSVATRRDGPCARHARRAGAMLLGGALSGIALAMSVAGAAGAAVLGPFSLSPASGPPGTVVTVSGPDCTPGLIVNGQDYVLVTSATLLSGALTVPVQASGSWQGNFTIPAGAPAAPALIVAACFSDGLPSLLTTYAPQTFTVTAPPVPTTAPPTTPPPATGGTGGSGGSGGTNSGATSGETFGSGTASTGSGGSGGTSATPGTPSAAGGAGSATVGAGVPDDAVDARAVESDADAPDSAGLASPALASDFDGGAGSSLAWLPWLLILLVCAAIATLVGWTRYARGNEVDGDPDGDPDAEADDEADDEAAPGAMADAAAEPT